MNKIAAALLLSLTAASAHALPIVFDSVSYATTAFAGVDGTADGPYADDTSPSPLPFISSASVAADADNLLLAAGIEADSTA